MKMNKTDCTKYSVRLRYILQLWLFIFTFSFLFATRSVSLDSMKSYRTEHRLYADRSNKCVLTQGMNIFMSLFFLFFYISFFVCQLTLISICQRDNKNWMCLKKLMWSTAVHMTSFKNKKNYWKKLQIKTKCEARKQKKKKESFKVKISTSI